MAHIWIVSLVSQDSYHHHAWPLEAHLTEATAIEARIVFEARLTTIRAQAKAREDFLQAWEKTSPRPPEALELLPGNPYRRKASNPLSMTAHGRIADVAWLVARHEAMAEAGHDTTPPTPEILLMAERLPEAHIYISTLPLVS